MESVHKDRKCAQRLDMEFRTLQLITNNMTSHSAHTRKGNSQKNKANNASNCTWNRIMAKNVQKNNLQTFFELFGCWLLRRLVWFTVAVTLGHAWSHCEENLEKWSYQTTLCCKKNPQNTFTTRKTIKKVSRKFRKIVGVR